MPFSVRQFKSFSHYLEGPDGAYISPFHDIPTWANEEVCLLVFSVNIVANCREHGLRSPSLDKCEIGGTRYFGSSYSQISKSDALNPIQQDEKKGVPRFVHNCFPHHGYIWNYGAVPQVS